MRPLILLLLALAACSADPVLLPDAGPCSSACGAGTACVAGACVAIDAGLDAGARCTPGTQGTCACLLGPMRAVYVCPASGVPPEPCPCAEDRDGAVRDAPAADLGVDAVTKDWPFEDRPAPMDVADVPRADVGADAGAADVPTDDGIFRWDRTAPQDDAGRLLCGASHGQACTTNADCARCIPGIWCCAGDGPGLMTCTGSSVFCVGP